MRVFIQPIIKLCGRLPLSVRIVLGRSLGYLFSLFPHRDREIAKLQMDRFIPAEGGSSNVGGMYAGLGQTLFESLNLKPYLSDPDRRITCPEIEKFREIFSGDQGVLLLSAHLSNWELFGGWTVKQGVDLAVIGREARDGDNQDLLSSIREDYGVEIIWKSDQSAAKRILSKLRSGKCVGALIDQDTRVGSLPIPFFGVSASSPSGIIALAKRANAKIASCMGVRTGFARYEARINEFDSSKSVEEILADFNDTLEGYIREYPDQWVWLHKRWRTLEDGTRLGSREYIDYLSRQLA